jgi:hypothetical protein
VAMPSFGFQLGLIVNELLLLELVVDARVLLYEHSRGVLWRLGGREAASEG